MTDREGRFVSREEFALLKERIDKGDGQSAGASHLWVLISGGIILVVTIVGGLLALSTYQRQRQERKTP